MLTDIIISEFPPVPSVMQLIDFALHWSVETGNMALSGREKTLLLRFPWKVFGYRAGFVTEGVCHTVVSRKGRPI